MSKRDDILKATEGLLWDVGYEAMSPKKVLQASGAGQGSLYHHFESKEVLTLAAIDSIQRDMRNELESIFLADKPPLEKLEAYILKPRVGLKGCRLGRLAQEKSVIESPLREVICHFFEDLNQHLITTILKAQADVVIKRHVDANDLAVLILSVIQGGYTMARITQDEKMMVAAQQGAWQLISEALV